MTPQKERFRARLETLRASLRGTDALLVSNLANVRYLTGFEGSSAHLFVSGKMAFFLTDARYGRYAVEGIEDIYEPVLIKGKFSALIRKLAADAAVKRLSFEKTVSYALYERLRATGLDLRAVDSPVLRLRMTKDAGEAENIKEAIRRAEDAFLAVRPYIRPGSSELAIARRLEEKVRRGGASGLPFPPIVASGPKNSAVPHARPTERRLAAGDFVVIDWGSQCGGYFSDMTRTFLLSGGGRMAEKRKIYLTVLEAQRAAIAASGAGKSAKEIDNSARYVIKQAGYGAHFVHGTGHGVGLEVHEAPTISARSADVPGEGAVFTVEPGIYVPGLGGVRIEDMIRLKAGKAEVLTSLPKSLRKNTVGGNW